MSSPQSTDYSHLLDHGYVKFIEHWGSDERIIESARMSTDGAFRGWGPLRTCKKCGVDAPGLSKYGCTLLKEHDFSGDEKLLRYLVEHKHTGPFEFCGMTLEIQAPIFVFRQWQRHRTQSYNELSARYTEMPDLFYVPSVQRICESAKASGNKQANGFELQCSPEILQSDYKNAYSHALNAYQRILASGVASELARSVLPVGIYSRMRAGANLSNWLKFLTLRMDAHAQWEIRQYANAVGAMIAERFPRTWELFLEGK